MIEIRRWFLFCLTFLAATAGLTGDPGTWVKADGPERLRDEFFIGGWRFKRAFRELASESRLTTVRFLQSGRPIALGTIIERDGGIISKASQIKDADQVQMSDGRKLAFTVVGWHTPLDLAYVKIEAETPHMIHWTAEAPQVGSWFVTLGPGKDPLGVGVMSVARRRIPTSGHGWMGISLANADGPVIDQVFINGGAHAAGIQQGDMVLKVDEFDILSRHDLLSKLQDYRPGDSIMVKVQRETQEIDFVVTLTHPFGRLLSRIGFQNEMGGDLSFRRDDFEAVFQHDTVLTPEQCGGPVVDLTGNALGINIARAGRTETYVLPYDLIEGVLPDLKAGKFPPPNASPTPTPQIAAEISESPEVVGNSEASE
ncbi:MAG: PDZ domain-containing protein [Planctomycetaceae bacterium]|nr:PDZ domain-containing protein [Planctomycetaceae bacterium]